MCHQISFLEFRHRAVVVFAVSQVGDGGEGHAVFFLSFTDVVFDGLALAKEDAAVLTMMVRAKWLHLYRRT